MGEKRELLVVRNGHVGWEARKEKPTFDYFRVGKKIHERRRWVGTVKGENEKKRKKGRIKSLRDVAWNTGGLGDFGGSQ